MSIKEIAERHATACVADISDGWGDMEDKKAIAEIAPHIERAIREAAQPLVEALENDDRGHGYLCSRNQYSSAVNVQCDCGYDKVLAALVEWRASK